MNYIKFGDYDSWEDFGLILTDFSIGFPSAKRYTVDIPGRNGELDLTDALCEEPVFEMREHSFTFRARHGRSFRSDILPDLLGKVHGKTLKVIVYDDPDWYWHGHCEIKEFALNRVSGDITIKMTADPYKLAINETTYEISSSGVVALANDVLSVTPTVTVTAETMITVGDSSLSLSAGTYYLTDFEIPGGGAEWEIETEGTVTITYRQGRL